MIRTIVLALLIFSCNSGETEKEFSTADPNVTAPDSGALIDTDNPYDSTYSVALDSNAQVILPEDTIGVNDKR